MEVIGKFLIWDWKLKDNTSYKKSWGKKQRKWGIMKLKGLENWKYYGGKLQKIRTLLLCGMSDAESEANIGN